MVLWKVEVNRSFPECRVVAGVVFGALIDEVRVDGACDGVLDAVDGAEDVGGGGIPVEVVGAVVGGGELPVVLCSVVPGAVSVGAVCVGMVSVGIVWVGWVSVGGSSVELVEGTGDVDETGSLVTGGAAELVEFSGLCLFAIFNSRAPKEAFSFCRASTALASVGNTPWRNLSDRRCKASWTLASSMFLRISCNEGPLESRSEAD